MKGSPLLKKIEIRDFTPLTSGGDYVGRKKEVKTEILNKISDIEAIKKKTIGKRIFLDVRFYLNDQTKNSGDAQKDLDNLLDTIFDVLPEKFTDEKNEMIDGVGLIAGNSDHMIFEVQSSKRFVEKHEDEGFDIEVWEFVEKKGWDREKFLDGVWYGITASVILLAVFLAAPAKISEDIPRTASGAVGGIAGILLLISYIWKPIIGPSERNIFSGIVSVLVPFSFIFFPIVSNLLCIAKYLPCQPDIVC